MIGFALEPPFRNRPAVVLAVAPLAVALCTLVKTAIAPIAPANSFILYFFAVAASAWVAGSGGGILATLLAGAAVLWARRVGLDAATAIRVSFFMLESAGIVWLIQLLRSAQEKAAMLTASAEASSLLLTNVMENVPSAVVATETDGTFFLFNRAAEQLTGFARDEVMGRPLLELFVPLPWHERVRSRFLPGANPAELSTPHRNPWRTKSGSERLIEWRCAAMPGQGGARIVGVGIDVTDLEALEAERARLALAERDARESAEEAGREKDRFLATVSHELRGPLTAMLGWAQLLSQASDNHGMVTEAARNIEENAHAQARLVDDLLDFTRIAAGQIQLESRPVRVMEVVRSAVDALRPEAQRKKLEIQTFAADAGIVVIGDEQRLRQVFMNVVQNAIRYTDAGFVQVGARYEGDRVRILIRDTGRGISPDFLPRVFDRFSQEAPGGGRNGLGLGLAIVQELVALHGGRVDVASGGPGCGTEFSIVLPLAS